MATRAVPAPLAQLPNALTILRLVLIPVFVVLSPVPQDLADPCVLVILETQLAMGLLDLR